MPFLPLPIPRFPIPMYFLKGLSFRTAVTRTPFPSSSNKSRSPARTPSLRRISRGTVTCPLTLSFASFFMAVTSHSLLYHRTPYFLRTRLSPHRFRLLTLKASSSTRPPHLPRKIPGHLHLDRPSDQLSQRTSCPYPNPRNLGAVASKVLRLARSHHFKATPTQLSLGCKRKTYPFELVAREPSACL